MENSSKHYLSVRTQCFRSDLSSPLIRHPCYDTAKLLWDTTRGKEIIPQASSAAAASDKVGTAARLREIAELLDQQ